MTGLVKVLAGSALRVRCHDELAVGPYSPSGESEGFRRLLSIDFVPRRPLREGFMIGLAGHGAGGSIELSIASVGSASRAGLLAVSVVLFGQGHGRGCPLLRSCCLTLSPSRQESFQGKMGSLRENIVFISTHLVTPPYFHGDTSKEVHKSQTAGQKNYFGRSLPVTLIPHAGS